MESREGKPAQVKGTGANGEAGVLRNDFPPGNNTLEHISWDKFFEKCFCFRMKPQKGETSYFNKLIYEEDSDKK